MPELIAKGPFEGQSAETRADVTLAPIAPCEIWSLALFPGAAKPAERALKELGLAFPAPNGLTEGKAGARLAWTGRDQAFLFGAAPPAGLDGHAALTDQSDGWAGLRLSGKGAAEVLARLVPVDLRDAAFPPGRAIRAPVNHMSALILRTIEGIEVWVFRSMARTAWHELSEAMQRREARLAQKV